MRFHLFVCAALAGLLLTATPVAADQSSTRYVDNDAVAVLMAMDQTAVRQSAIVRFWKPVRVGDRILMGKYIVEHDTDRMGRGEPCTHIYDFYDRSKPVVTFHCIHLTRPRAATGTVTVLPQADATGIAVLREFQFEGDVDAHGVPSDR